MILQIFSKYQAKSVKSLANISPMHLPSPKIYPNLPWKCAKTQKERPVSQALFFRESCCVSFHPSSPIFTHLHITKHFYVPRKISLGNGLEVDVIEMPAHFMERWAYDSRHTSWVGWEVILLKEEIRLTSWWILVYPFVYSVLYIPGDPGLIQGFFHQQYYYVINIGFL